MGVRRIVRTPPVSWRSRLALMITIFGVVWLFAEPLPAFGVRAGLFQMLGPWGYVALLGVAVMGTGTVEYYKRAKSLGRITFVRFRIILTQDGTIHVVEAPEEMLVRVFIELFLRDVAAENQNSYVARWDMFETTLLVERPPNSRNFVAVNKNQTLKGVGLAHNDTCRLSGKVLDPEVVFSQADD